MNYDLVTILVISAVLLGVFYFVTNTEVVKNKGELSVEPQPPVDQMLPKFKPKLDQEQVEDPLRTIGPFDPQQGVPPERGAQMNPIKQNTNVLPYPQISNNYAPQQANIKGQFGIDTGAQPKLDCFPKDTITPQELMPREDSYNTWQASNPPVNGHLADRNFLESGHHYGIDTVSNTLKNPNLQLRSDPIIPQIQVGPWMQSTYGPDTNHRQLEIGGDY
jgi:hypothetical protein